MLHSNLLGRLGNGLLKFVVLVVMVCNVSGAFAEPKTISTNTTLSSATPYDDDVTVNPGVTLTINSEVTIMGNLINNGGTIIVGEGGVLTVTGNVTNTSAYSTTEYVNEGSTSSTSYDPKENPDWPGGYTYPKTRNRTTTVTTTTTSTPVFKVGSINVSNGGSVTINGDFSNNSTLSVQTTSTEYISKVVVKGNLVNENNTTASSKKRVTTITTVTTQSQERTSYRDNSIKPWQDISSSNSTSVSDGVSVSSTTTGTINLSNGYLVVKGSMELQDNSVINYNTASSLGDGIQSTINVSGSVIQAENADINLASGAKGKLIVAETYTDNTTTDGNANHPWSITDESTLAMNSGFDLYATKYVSAKLSYKLDEINELLADLNEQLAAISGEGKTLDDYLKEIRPTDWTTYQTGTCQVWEQTGTILRVPVYGFVTHPFTYKYTTFSAYLYYENRDWLNALGDFFGANGYGNFTQTMTEQQTETINELRTEIATNTTLKETFEDLIETLEQKGVKALQIEAESEAVSTLLPIELTSFTATATEYGYTFNWVTASEVENDYFTLEYSIDGVDFNEIDYVHGAGTTSETSEYTYRWDEAPEFDVVYFRLKQTDYNGEYSYSDVIVASRKKSSGANGTFRYGPLNLQIQDGELRYIVK